MFSPGCMEKFVPKTALIGEQILHQNRYKPDDVDPSDAKEAATSRALLIAKASA